MNFQQTADRYRTLYREDYMRCTISKEHLEDGRYTNGVAWGDMRFPLFNDDDDSLGQSFLVVTFHENLEDPEIVAANNISPLNGGFLASIHISKALYDMVDGDDSTTVQNRKCFLAHEWLEAVQAIANRGRERSRKVASKSDLLVIAAQLSRSTKTIWEDKYDENEDLKSGLRELLVSATTIKRYLRESAVSQTPENLTSKFIQIASEESVVAAERMVLGLANEFSQRLNVDAGLVKQRIYEVIGL